MRPPTQQCRAHEHGSHVVRRRSCTVDPAPSWRRDSRTRATNAAVRVVRPSHDCRTGAFCCSYHSSNQLLGCLPRPLLSERFTVVDRTTNLRGEARRLGPPGAHRAAHSTHWAAHWATHSLHGSGPCPEPRKLTAGTARTQGSNLHLPVGSRRVAYGWVSECSAMTRFASQRSAGAAAVTVWARPRRAARGNWAIHLMPAAPVRLCAVRAARNWRRQESRRRAVRGRPQAAEGRRRL